MAQCDPWVCEPSERACTSSSSWKQCQANGFGWSGESSCGEGTACVEGDCREVICEGEQKRCADFAVLEVCAENGTAFTTLDNCGSGYCGGTKDPGCFGFSVRDDVAFDDLRTGGKNTFVGNLIQPRTRRTIEAVYFQIKGERGSYTEADLVVYVRQGDYFVLEQQVGVACRDSNDLCGVNFWDATLEEDTQYLVGLYFRDDVQMTYTEGVDPDAMHAARLLGSVVADAPSLPRRFAPTVLDQVASMVIATAGY